MVGSDKENKTCQQDLFQEIKGAVTSCGKLGFPPDAHSQEERLPGEFPCGIVGKGSSKSLLWLRFAPWLRAQSKKKKKKSGFYILFKDRSVVNYKCMWKPELGAGLRWSHSGQARTGAHSLRPLLSLCSSPRDAPLSNTV